MSRKRKPSRTPQRHPPKRRPTPGTTEAVVHHPEGMHHPPAAVAVPIADPGAGNKAAQSDGRLESYLHRNAPEVVGVSFWFDPPAQPPVQSATLRIVGQRIGVIGHRKPGDRFVHEETVDAVVAGSGPVAVTAKIRDVSPGEWAVDAQALLHTGNGPTGSVGHPHPVPAYPAGWSWRRWRVTAAPSAPVRTRLAPLVSPPAVLLGSWLALVVVGILLGLLTQSLLLSAEHLRLGHAFVMSVGTVLAGAAGAKIWYRLLHRRERRREGWALQGFVTGVAVTAPLLLWLLAVPVGPYLDASGPALMVGAASGRLGCFLTGCCAGRPTASRWGVWSSNRWLGARRIPTQLLESGLALLVGVILLAVLRHSGPQQGALFIAGVAAYTLLRQPLLLLREERRRSRLGPALIASAAAVGLVLDIAVVARLG